MTAARKIKLKTCLAKDCNNTYQQFDSLTSWCSPACGYAISQARLEKKRRKEALKTKRENLDAKRKFKLADRPYQMKLTQAVVNKWVVHVRDHDKGCFTCPETFASGNKYGGVIDCGHYLTVGAHPERRLEVRQLARQCIKCNRYNGGRPDIFRLALIEREGLEFVEWLEGPEDRIKQTCADLITTRSYYSGLIREWERLRG